MTHGYMIGRGIGAQAMGDVPLLISVQGATAILLEGRANQVSKTWSPTGFYTPDQVTKVIGELTQLYVAVLTPLNEYEKGTKIDLAGVRHVKNRLATVYSRGVIFQQAALQAKAQGFKYLDAPGFKRFVVDFLYGMAGGVSGYSILARNDAAMWEQASRDTLRLFLGPLGSRVVSWSGYMNDLASLMVKIVNVILAIAGVAVDVVVAAGSAVLKIPDAVGTLITVVKWGALLVGGAWVYTQVEAHRKK